MTKLVFITDSGFWSHKPEVIKELNIRYQLSVYVFYTKGFNNHSFEDIKRFGELNNIDVRIINLIYRARSLNNILYLYKTIILQILKETPNIVYAESFGSPYFLFLLKIFYTSRRVVIGVHDFELHKVTKNKISYSGKLYKSIFLHLFENFHFFSSKQERKFKEHYPLKNTTVVRLYLVGADYREIKVKKKNRKSFLFFGRIQFYKGVDILLEAVNILAKKRKDFNVIIAGSTNDKEYYLNFLDKGNASLVEFYLGHIKNEEIPKLFSRASYFVAPYREVTQSGPLMMAYNYNLIPIASDDEGFTEYITNGVNGFTFVNEKPEDLAKIIDRACNLSDFEFNKIKDNLNIFISKEFDIKLVGDRYEAMFNKLVLDNEK